MIKHFDKKELIRCYRDEGRCKECKLAQAVVRMPYGIEDSVMALVEDVLEPVRVRLGKSIVVNSGFRCPLHNRTVGGATGSQHMRGEAADIRCDDNRRLAKLIVEVGKYDQLIIYPSFVHVSWKRGGGNRREILRKTATGYERVDRL